MIFKMLLTVFAFGSAVALTGFAADIYKVDPAHSSLMFSVRHLGINDVKGIFTNYTGDNFTASNNSIKRS